MTDRHDLIAYLATLFALVALEAVAFFAAGHGVSVTEAFGLGTITGGLIGVMRMPHQREVNAKIVNTPEERVPVNDATDSPAGGEGGPLGAKSDLPGSAQR